MSQSARTDRAGRRDFLSVAAATVGSMAIGCRGDQNSVAVEEVAPRTDVPLRVVYCGPSESLEPLARAWSAIQSQGLDVQRIDVDRAAPSGLLEAVSQAAAKSDVVVCPLMAVPALATKELVTPLNDEEVAQLTQQCGSLHAAVRNGMVRFDGKAVATPLGARQPALIVSEPTETLDSWQAYDAWVHSLGGAVAEPLADGWAAAMFLWRATSSVDQRWLFARQNLEPQIDTAPFVSTLSQLVATANRYNGDRLTPREIWDQLKSGSLQAAIGFPFPGDEAGDDGFQFFDPPAAAEAPMTFDPFSPVAMLSASCRQSAATKTFIRWLAGGEASDSLRREIPDLTLTREPAETDREISGRRPDRYEQWLGDRLQRPNTLPTLQLLAADEYYSILDAAVVSCLDGDQEPEAALGDVKSQWVELTEVIGPAIQQRVWRSVQKTRG